MKLYKAYVRSERESTIGNGVVTHHGFTHYIQEPNLVAAAQHAQGMLAENEVLTKVEEIVEDKTKIVYMNEQEPIHEVAKVTA